MKLVIRRERGRTLLSSWHVWRARCGHLVVATGPTQQECLRRALLVDYGGLADDYALAGPNKDGAW